jgi:hypothetical protein
MLAHAMAVDPYVVSKIADLPSQSDFDEAIADLAAEMKQPGEDFHRAYARAMQSREGELLYRARDWVPPTIQDVRKRDTQPPLMDSEVTIQKAMDQYAADHPACPRHLLLTRTLEANPQLYTDYEAERQRRARSQ